MVKVQVEFSHENGEGKALVPSAIVGQHEGTWDLPRGDGAEAPRAEMVSALVLIARAYMNDGGLALDRTLRPEFGTQGAEERCTWRVSQVSTRHHGRALSRSVVPASDEEVLGFHSGAPSTCAPLVTLSVRGASGSFSVGFQCLCE